MGNMLNYQIVNNSVWNFDASNDVAFLAENTSYFTEDSIVRANQARQTTIGYEFWNNSGYTYGTNSFEYTFFSDNYWNSPYVSVSGATGLLLRGGAIVQNGSIGFHANVNGPSDGTVVLLSGSADTILREQIAIQSEYDGGGQVRASPTTAVSMQTAPCNAMAWRIAGVLRLSSAATEDS